MTHMAHRVRLKKTSKAKSTINLAPTESFKAAIGGKFPPVLTLEYSSVETLTWQFNGVMVEAANETIGKRNRKPHPRIDRLITCQLL